MVITAKRLSEGDLWLRDERYWGYDNERNITLIIASITTTPTSIIILIIIRMIIINTVIIFIFVAISIVTSTCSEELDY